MPFEMDSTISIHAPREGGDSEMATISGYLTDFNPRPPRGGRHRDVLFRELPCFHFNPRPPRGGDPAADPGRPTPCDFNPRPPRGGDAEAPADGSLSDISIHAPCEGGDSSKGGT